MTRRSARGLAAEYDSREALDEATKAACDAGYARIDVFTPYPIPDLARPLGIRRSPIPFLAVAAGISGAIVQYWAQYWMNAIDFPILIAGHQLNDWPAFLPGSLIVAFFWAALAIFFTFLVLTGLPRLHHPMFDLPGFGRVGEDRMFLFIGVDDPQFDSDETAAFLKRPECIAVHRVGWP